jgi:hypothetical protein
LAKIFALDGIDLPFAFIDSWAKHPSNLEDPSQQSAFGRQASVVWDFAQNHGDLFFKSVQVFLHGPTRYI